VTDRRRFLKLTGAAVAASAAAAPLLRALEGHADAERTERIDRIGIQLYTVRNEMKANVDRTLARLAQIGYKEVEFAGYFGRTPTQVAESLTANGLTAPGAHIGIADIRGPNWPRMLDAAHTMGHQYLIVAWLDLKDRASQDGYKAIADSMNGASAAAARAGVTIGYHNHDFEFTPLDGRTGLDVMLERTAGLPIAFEMDLYWMVKAGQDPLAWFAKWPGRFPLVHVKDSAGPPKHEMRDVGAGSMDWKQIFARRKQAGIKHYFVEHDEPGDAFASAAASFAYLKTLTF